jgi:hypothetical protein
MGHHAHHDRLDVLRGRSHKALIPAPILYIAGNRLAECGLTQPLYFPIQCFAEGRTGVEPGTWGLLEQVRR